MELAAVNLSTSSSSGGENEVERNIIKHPVRRRTPDEQNFRKLYRFSLENFNFVVDNFLPPYSETRGGALSNHEKMRVFLRYVHLRQISRTI